MRKEDRIILLVARIPFEDEARSSLDELLRHPLDQQYLTVKAFERGVGGLLYRHLKGVRQRPQALELITKLKGEYLRQAALTTLIIEEAKTLIVLLRAEGVSSIVLKGIDLIERMYRDASLRPLSDIDLLVRREDVPRVNEILLGRGYRQPGYYQDFLHVSNACRINSLYYRGDSAVCPLHLHWHLINTTWPLENAVRRIDIDAVWERSNSDGFAGASRLSDEDCVAYLTYHALVHGFDRLILAVDIAETIRTCKATLDWDSVARISKCYGLKEILSSVIAYVCTLTGCAGPVMETREAGRLRLSEKFLFSCVRSKRLSFSQAAYLMYLIRQDTVAKKLRFILDTLFPAKLVMAHNYEVPVASIDAYHYLRRATEKFL